MIKPALIKIKARQEGVREQQIEKDYVLSWILKGLSGHPELSCQLVMKGGTVLKKFYFRGYRYSEDLDFTLPDSSMEDKRLLAGFDEVFARVLEEANLPLELESPADQEKETISFYIRYTGPLGGQGSSKKIKVDISRSESLAFGTQLREALNEYPDLAPYRLNCYALEEVLVEKMRSVMQRMQARDFFDIWYLLEVHGLALDFCLKEFEMKCANKGLRASDFLKKLSERMPSYHNRWRGSLGDQIRDLPDFQQVEREVMRHFRTLPF